MWLGIGRPGSCPARWVGGHTGTRRIELRAASGRRRWSGRGDSGLLVGWLRAWAGAGMLPRLVRGVGQRGGQGC